MTHRIVANLFIVSSFLTRLAIPASSQFRSGRITLWPYAFDRFYLKKGDSVRLIANRNNGFVLKTPDASA